MTVRIICDSSLNVPDSYLERLQIIECPASVVFGEESYLNKVEMSHEEFYRRLAALPSGAPLPTTAQPTPAQFKDALEMAKAEGASAAVITTVSAQLSGTYNSAVQAAELEEDIPVTVWDTKGASMGGGWQTIAVAEMAQAGASYDEIVAALPDLRQRCVTALTVDTLKYLVAGGRVTPVQGMMGTLLNIKPMLIIEDGVLKPVGRERGRKRAKRALLNLIRQRVGDHPLRVAVVNANVPEEAQAYTEDVRQQLNVQELIVVEVGPVIAALAGPGVLALAALEVTA